MTTSSPTSSSTVTLIGAKGGAGTSTVAAMYALTLARTGQPVRLSATDSAGVEDLATILAVPVPAPGQIVEAGPGLTLADHTDAESANVVDGGTDRFSDHSGAVYVVLRNEFQSLRRALDVPRTTVGAILVIEAKRALGARDAADVLSYPIVAELHIDPSLARLIDAGLLATARNIRVDLGVTAQPASAR